MEITIDIDIEASLNDVWHVWTTPEEITHWNFASDEWCCPTAKIHLVEGGKFNYRMEAKDGSMGFDFEGQFTKIELCKSIHYKMDDDRHVKVEFRNIAKGTKVVETFEAESEHSAEQQRQGWLCILANFKQRVESKGEEKSA
ncbi:SRPBCC domain-containing protein [Aliiglaciecola litoralis]|uniref:SRPBCC family protein n=1 Tax=Aliiglaciecola litoralis TaxID=582857 RepID=A0ABP3WRD5_9ALTE